MNKRKLRTTPDYFRVRRGTVQTAVLAYRHDNGRVVTVVGTMHIGSRQFYESVRGYVETLRAQGATVHCEGVAASTSDEDRSEATGLVKSAIEAWDESQELNRLTAPHLGWVTQAELSTKGWESRDLSLPAVAKLMGPAVLVAHVRSTSRVLKWPAVTRRRIRRFRIIMSVSMRILSRLAARPRPVPARNPWAKAQQHRSDLAAEGALESVGDVVLVWGANHVPGIHEALTGVGYVATHVGWMSVGRLPSLVDIISGRRIALDRRVSGGLETVKPSR